jgi:hypothetical protein
MARKPGTKNPATMDLNELGNMFGITERDKNESFHPAQKELGDASRAKNERSNKADENLDPRTVGEAEGKSATRMTNSLMGFRNAKTTGEKNIHRRAYWNLAEGITRDSGADSTGRRTRATFIQGQPAPCANENCHNEVPYETPAVEREIEKKGGPRASDVTCAEGKCNIPGSEAPTRSRE